MEGVSERWGVGSLTYGKPQESLNKRESTRNSLLAQGMMQRHRAGDAGWGTEVASCLGAKVLGVGVLSDKGGKSVCWGL